MQALELLDVQKEFVSGENLALIKKGLAHAEGIQAFAMKVDGVVEQEGSMSDVLEVSCSLRVERDTVLIRKFPCSSCLLSNICPCKRTCSL
jgi:hypothetical protein